MDDLLERFAGLYDQCYRNVLHYALQHAESGSAEDVASEAFLIAWRRWPDLPEPPLPWLLGVTRNLLRQQAAAGRRRRLLADRIVALSSETDMVAWDAGEHVVERAAALDALASLSERDVEALTLVTWHGLDLRAAASVVGCTPATFAVRLHRARRRLTAALRAADRTGKFPAQQPAASRPLTAGRPRPAAAPRHPIPSTSEERT